MIIITAKIDERCFHELSEGDVFRVEGNLFMRTQDIYHLVQYSGRDDETFTYNAIHLKTGQLTYFMKTMLVEPIIGAFVIGYKEKLP